MKNRKKYIKFRKGYSDIAYHNILDDYHFKMYVLGNNYTEKQYHEILQSIDIYTVIQLDFIYTHYDWCAYTDAEDLSKAETPTEALYNHLINNYEQSI